MTAADLQADLAELESAEDFLDYFAVPYDAALVRVCRLHILQRFHDYLAHNCGEQAGRDDYRRWLAQAYQDFVVSTPLEQKVFQVLKRQAGIAAVPVTAIGRSRP